MSGFVPLTQAQLTQAAQQGYVADAVANGLLVANTGKGSSLGAFFNGGGLLGMMLSRQFAYVASVARVFNPDATLSSTGADLDSFFAPFGVLRSPASPSSNVVQMTAQPGLTPVWPEGGILTIGSLQFQVLADPSNPAYVAAQNGYPVTPASPSLNVTVQCLTPGSVGNLPIGASWQVVNATGIPQTIGVASVANFEEFSNGADSEDDVPFVQRATAKIAGGNAGPALAVWAAAMSAQLGLTIQIGDALDSTGNITPGSGTVFVNTLGQSAGPSPALLAAVRAAIISAKPAGAVFTVVGPTLSVVNADVSVKSDGSVPLPNLLANVQNAFDALVNGIGMMPVAYPPVSGALTTLPYWSVIEAIGSVLGVQYPSNLRLNGGYADISVGYGTQLVAGTINVTPT